MSTLKIKAAVMHQAGEPLVIQELQLADPESGEVRVSLKACAICHSDISMLNGDWAGSEVPCVAGHEASGIIESTGSDVTSVAVGDHVVVTLVRSCGNCHACRAGHTVGCSGTTALDSESRLTDSEGRRVVQGIRTGAFAEAAVVHESQVVKISKDIPFTSAALLGCGVITGFCSVTNIADVEAGSSVVIVGAGGLGLNTIQGAALSGASTIIAIDVLDIKLQAALDLGATHVINALEKDTVAEVLALCDGGADYVFVSTGRSQSIAQSIDMLSKFGSSVILGMPPDEDKMFAIDSHSLTTGKRILGSKMGDTCIQKDIPKLIGLYQQGKLKLDELVSKTFPLHEINEAIETSERGEALRNVITYD
jgi:S-(hydroxymethyl)glutathione dehydrogenase/alcohol dehydrogenase